VKVFELLRAQKWLVHHLNILPGPAVGIQFGDTRKRFGINDESEVSFG
jgi:hypothetical protein